MKKKQFQMEIEKQLYSQMEISEMGRCNFWSLITSRIYVEKYLCRLCVLQRMLLIY